MEKPLLYYAIHPKIEQGIEVAYAPEFISWWQNSKLSENAIEL